MIQANELRIGNLVERFDFQVLNGIDLPRKWVSYEILSVDIVEVTMFPDHYRPVPLTVEKLLEFGFEQSIPKTKIFSLGSFWIRYYGEEIGFFESKNHKKLEHVHQLQNLYFALTGTELTGKPE